MREWLIQTIGSLKGCTSMSYASGSAWWVYVKEKVVTLQLTQKNQHRWQLFVKKHGDQHGGVVYASNGEILDSLYEIETFLSDNGNLPDNDLRGHKRSTYRDEDLKREVEGIVAMIAMEAL